MFRNYLAATLRNLARNRLYAAMQVLGLSVGFAAAILIALFVRDEFSYDKWIPGYQNVYRLAETIQIPGQQPIKGDTVFAHVAQWLKLDFPEIQDTARLIGDWPSVHRGDVEYNEKVYWADPSFFKILPMPVVAGDLNAALAVPDGAVLTRAMARKYFNRDDPVGETLEISNPLEGLDSFTVRVTAVIEDLPSSTHLDGKIFLSGLAAMSRITRSMSDAFSEDHVPGENAYTYVAVKPSASVEPVGQGLRSFLDRHLPARFHGIDYAKAYSYELVPLAAIHLRPAVLGTMLTPGDLGTIIAVSAVAFLILLVAAINFVNLMTARALRRAVEVGVRKAAGASRRDLVVQFLGESLIYALLAMVIGVSLIEILLPSFNAFLDRTIRFDYWKDPSMVGAILGMTALVGLLAGSYPALVLSSFRPAQVLKGGRAGASGSGKLRQALVVLQFAVLVGLLISTAVIYRQTEFAIRGRLTFEQDPILIVFGDSCHGAYKDEVKATPGVMAVACVHSSTLGIDRNGTAAILPDGRTLMVRLAQIEPDFFDVFNLKPLAGRVLSESHGADVHTNQAESGTNPPIVINETAARELGYAQPQAAIGQTARWPSFSTGTGKAFDAMPSEIVGVIPDFSIASVRDAVEPTFYYVDTDAVYMLTVKLKRDAVPETLKSIDALWKKSGRVSPMNRQFIDQRVQEMYVDIEREENAFAALAGIAVFVALLGLFGLSAFTAEQRTKEIGVRKAMGASTGNIVSLLLWQFSKPVLWSNLVAWPIAGYAMNRWLESFAYHIDLAPWMFAASAAVALVIAMLTVVTHSFLVARSKPVSALRYE